MNFSIITRFLYLFIVSMAFSIGLAAQDAFKQPVVKISSQNEYGEDEQGAGVLIGQAQSELFFMTAAHVLASPNDIRIGFLEGTTIKGELVKANASLDIAVIKCNQPEGFSIPPSFAITKEAEKVLQQVVVIGHPLDNQWDINYNSNVKSTEYDLDERLFTLAPIGIAPGNSGGPVTNLQNELLGLVREVNPVNAICVNVETLLKACQAWEVPVNLMTGITIENNSSTAGEEDFRYQILVQEAKTAFAAGKWAQAKRAFEELNTLAPAESYTSKIQQCEVELAKDLLYQQLMEKAKDATKLDEALAFYREAQLQRNTEEVRQRIGLIEEKLALLEVPTNKDLTTTDNLPENYQHPLAGKLALVRGGTFTMGNEAAKYDDEFPPHQVFLADYYLGVHEITIQQFCLFLSDLVAMFPQLLNDKVTGPNLSRELKAYCNNNHSNILSKKVARKVSFYPREGSQNLPVSTTWFGANAYCRWLSEKTGQVYRLPTEAEWEYAARGGIKAKATKYAGSNNADEVAWYRDNTYDNYYVNQKKPIMTKASNELGIYDMNGNLWEWCQDWHNENYYETCKKEGVVVNPFGPKSGKEKVMRGGGAETELKALRYPYELSLSERESRQRHEAAGLRIVRMPYETFSFRDPFEKEMVFIEGGKKLPTSNTSGNTNSQNSISIEPFYYCKKPVSIEDFQSVMGMGFLPSNTVFWTGAVCDSCPIEELLEVEAMDFLEKLNRKSQKKYRFVTSVEKKYLGIQPGGYYLALDPDR